MVEGKTEGIIYMKTRFEIAVEEEFVCMLAGVELYDYYSSPVTMIKAQLSAREVMEKRFGCGRFVHLYPTLSSYAEASALGVDVVFPEGDSLPWPKQQLVLETIDDVDSLEIRRNSENNLVEKTIQYYHVMKNFAGGKYDIAIEKCVEGPITTAIMLRGQDFFTDIYDDPGKAHKLLSIITETSLDIRKQIEEATGQEMTSTWIYDDYAGMLSPSLYKEFAIPYYKEIYKNYGRYGRVLHSELLSTEHLQISKAELDITYYNPASAQNLDIESVKQIMGPYFDWQITPEQMAMPKNELIDFVNNILDKQPPIISIYPYSNTPLENLSAVIELLKQVNE